MLVWCCYQASGVNVTFGKDNCLFGHGAFPLSLQIITLILINRKILSDIKRLKEL